MQERQEELTVFTDQLSCSLLKESCLDTITRPVADLTQ
jgi:hypothetical protein